MNACRREEELLDALGRGFVDADLETHVSGCASCSELRTVAGALLDDRAGAIREAAVPGSGTMWWRMQIRRRHDAQATARRSLMIGQAATLLVALALMASLFGNDVTAGLKDVAAALRVHTALLLVLATALLALPIAGWVALRQK